MSTLTIPTWTLGDRMQKALDVSGVSVRQMADELGVSRNTASNYLHGHTKPSRSVLRVWALRTGVPFEWIATGETSNTDTATGGNNGRYCPVQVLTLRQRIVPDPGFGGHVGLGMLG